MIKLKNITKIYQSNGKTIVALDNISLHVPAGQIFGVIGASGAGKSTLIRTINLLERPTSGQVIVDNQELNLLDELQLTKVRRQIGMIFQHFNLLSSRTVFDNIMFPLELQQYNQSTSMESNFITKWMKQRRHNQNENKKRVNELLDIVNLSDKAMSYPASLSGGQKQRVAIARALANKPKVLLCDEATSALDPATTRSILTLLKEINRQLNLTILLITHEMDVVKSICDQVAIISNGKLVEQNEVNQIFSHPQSSLAKDFIDSTLQINVPEDYKYRLQSQSFAGSAPLLQLKFHGQSFDTIVFTEMANRYGVSSNILTARMDYVKGIKFGAILAEFSGDEQNIKLAIEFLKQQNIDVEVMGYV